MNFCSVTCEQGTGGALRLRENEINETISIFMVNISKLPHCSYKLTKTLKQHKYPLRFFIVIITLVACKCPQLLYIPKQ